MTELRASRFVARASTGPSACRRAVRRTLCTLAVLGTLASWAAASVATDQPASILIFPEIVAETGRDTIIQITNTRNNLRYARCFYVSASGSCASNAASCTTNAECPLGDVCTRTQTQTEFDIALTKQQPTFWVASQGRLPSNAPPGLNNLVPPVTPPFRGALMCVEVDSAAAPVAGNAFIGEATLVDSASGDIAKYHAVGLEGFDNNMDDTLCVGGSGGTNACPFGEYAACPQSWALDHLAAGAQDSIIGAGSAVNTTLSIVPCTIDLTSQTPQAVNISFAITNELAAFFSASTSISGPSDIQLASIPAFTRNVLGTDYAQTQIASVAGQVSGIVTLAQEFHSSGGPGSLTASAALNPHSQGSRAEPDTIVLPASNNGRDLPPPAGAAVFRTSGSPQAITSGPDGNLWFTEILAPAICNLGSSTCTGTTIPCAIDEDCSKDQIGRITPAGVIQEFDTVNPIAGPHAITTGPDGNLWFTETNAARLGRISTDGTVQVEFPISNGANDITSGPDGNLWFTEFGAANLIGVIGSIAPDGTGLREFPLATPNQQPLSITRGADGNLWFTEQGDAGPRIGRITTDGSSIMEFDVASGLSNITPGPDGNLWFVEAAVSQIARITPAGVFGALTEFPVPGGLGPGTTPSIAPVGDGNLWFTRGFVCELSRVTPSGVVTVFLNLCGGALTGGPDNNVWLLRLREIVRFSP